MPRGEPLRPDRPRTDDEVEAWLARDPIPTYRDRLLASGLDPEALDRVEREALELVDRATEEAKAGPYPEPEALGTELWADGGSAWRS